ncbi:hypothetical protein K2173_005401 [Erythroxylum novogranatense]|uniref:BED-type domain-containing protein n=1 Tax=Erythroxylum novogranatense TaxID=1862640 RepID=A0AAV8TCV6_9ROSI|nr:hypothetical protein K2173_005401 [Erythroxylum novogranatense]
MVRGRDACWEHCVLVDATRQKVRCNYCNREFSGGVYRMKFHLAQIKNKDIIPCTEVPDDVRDHIRKILSTPKNQKTPKKLRMSHATSGQQGSSSGDGGLHPNHESSGQQESIDPSLLFPCPIPIAQPVADDTQTQKQDNADKKVAVFFFQNSIPFSAAKSLYYQETVDAIAECGVGYKAPSYEKLRSTLLDKVKGEIQDRYKKYQDEWKETGCTVLCDSLSDDSAKTIVIFSLTCSKGTLYLKSVDISGHQDDATYLFELIESIILEVGVEYVIQVITDSSASYIYAGRLLMAKYSTLFWSPCASYCIDKMLEDLSKQECISTVLEGVKNISRYIYSHAWVLSLIRKFTGGRELIRTGITRFVTNYLTLRNIVILEDNLKHMLSHSEWLSSVYSRHPDAQVIKSLLYQDRFWKSAHEAVSISEPLLKVLRIVDGHMPAMGYIYEGIERAKAAIKTYYEGAEEKYTPIWDIIDRRWTMQLHSPIHAAAAFLNPSIFYNPNFKIDLRMRNGFQEAMAKMAVTDKDKIEITKEHPMYINAQGALGTEFAIMGRTLNAPGDWWAGYGYEIPTLQRVAIRILSQPCSSYWCRWNWSTFDSIHSKKRNRAELEKLNDLVFVHCNLWLQTICQSRKGICNPVIFYEVDVGLEWPSETESSFSLVDDSWLDNLPLEGKSSP